MFLFEFALFHKDAKDAPGHRPETLHDHVADHLQLQLVHHVHIFHRKARRDLGGPPCAGRRRITKRCEEAGGTHRRRNVVVVRQNRHVLGQELDRGGVRRLGALFAED